MKVCFIGHRIIPQDIKPRLEKTLKNLINENPDVLFYVGDHGQFDSLTRSVLLRLQKIYPEIRIVLVLSYMPTSNPNKINNIDTLLPEAVARAIPRYAIDRRNRWVIENSDTVISYVTHSYGGAAKFKRIAISQKKHVIELGTKKAPD